MPPSPRGSRSPQAVLTLAIGVLLSVVLVVPSVLYSVRYGSGDRVFHAVFNVMLLGAVTSPFVVIYWFTRNRSRAVAAVTFGAVFSLCHAWLIYVSYAFKPQEFGYLGLIFAPFLEAAIGVPISLVLVFIVKRVNRH